MDNFKKLIDSVESLTLKKDPAICLRQKSTPIENIDDDVKHLAVRMLKTMYENNGIGLAANQVGINKRIIVFDVYGNSPQVFVNPEIIEKSNSEIAISEGCLSVPNFNEKVKRSDRILVKYMDLDGNENTVIAEKLLAICIQHEIDHLDGILFVDRISFFKKSKYLKKRDKK